jgi:hypothetical protein
MGEDRNHPAGSQTMARLHTDDPVTWETPVRPSVHFGVTDHPMTGDPTHLRFENAPQVGSEESALTGGICTRGNTERGEKRQGSRRVAYER